MVRPRLASGGRVVEPPVTSAAVTGRGRLLTCREVGELLHVAPREVVRFIRTRGLPGVHLGRKLGWRVLEADLWAWLDQLRQGGTS